ncbi:MAG: hypothetical protein UR66_C0018G0029 [Candidatus Moranbacteria bacterium GW2011_GWE1_35_17]|nr:MAG: hypothetical protein UR66_C0018G0029 [Candidatus Moranbacteria bacterium GW2011_GWE1_35_17]KKP83322.1 MAG: hypothetical protein UR82_C0022G0015 [Candidatus Moranbacteria bacterium GW2011_GWF1_35_5]KKP84714.1 MAG: hypothetical protein UR83_C0014G0017 [Candidatus Moranbacteria bacterium GW2011_GWF2_35_54]
MSKRGDDLYFEDIISSIEKIENYTNGMKELDFYNDHKTIDAVVRNLSIIGEAVNSLSEDAKLVNSNIPWGEIIGMRNKIVHEYFGVDEEILWKTIQEDLPKFRELIKGIK